VGRPQCCRRWSPDRHGQLGACWLVRIVLVHSHASHAVCPPAQQLPGWTLCRHCAGHCAAPHNLCALPDSTPLLNLPSKRLQQLRYGMVCPLCDVRHSLGVPPSTTNMHHLPNCSRPNKSSSVLTTTPCRPIPYAFMRLCQGQERPAVLQPQCSACLDHHDTRPGGPVYLLWPCAGRCSGRGHVWQQGPAGAGAWFRHPAGVHLGE